MISEGQLSLVATAVELHLPNEEDLISESDTKMSDLHIYEMPQVHTLISAPKETMHPQSARENLVASRKISGVEKERGSSNKRQPDVEVLEVKQEAVPAMIHLTNLGSKNDNPAGVEDAEHHQVERDNDSDNDEVFGDQGSVDDPELEAGTINTGYNSQRAM